MTSRSSSRRPLALLFALLAIAALGGCSLAPGGHLASDAASAPIDDLVDIQPITPGLVALGNGQGGAQAMSEALQREIADWQYRIGPGDVLSITVYDHPELTIPAGSQRSAEEAGNQVRNDGTIFYPFIGRVQVAGRTLDEVRRELTRRLSAYITEPQVDVGVAAFRSQKVHVSGAVREPQALAVSSVPLTVADAISRVGGAEENANWHEVILTRDGEAQRLSLFALLREGDQRHNRLLRDGDVLHVTSAENQAVSVMGQVLRPGNVALGNERLTLTDALSRAGGVNEATAEPSGIFVIRSEPEGEKLATVYQLDIRNAAAFALGSRFTLEPRDVVYVTTAPLARWNRVISLLLPSLRLPGFTADSVTDTREL